MSRVALVTGAARGQGAAIAARLRADGFQVAAADLLAITDENVLPLELDVTSEAQWTAAVAAVVEQFGRLDVLVNNAGALHRAPLGEETAEGFERAWRINTLGPFLGITACLDQLRLSDGAAIVNTCSTGAIRPFPFHAAYGSSKWALRGLTQITAAELARDGIRVNAVFPGPIETPMLDETARERLAARAYTGRLGKPTEIADAVAFLVSEAAAFITGSELVVDGGQCLQIG